MPLYRGGRGHAQAAKRLKKGELPIAARNDDESVFWHRHKSEDFVADGALFYGDYLLYGYWPWRMPWLVLAFLCACLSLSGFVSYASALAHSQADRASTYICIALATLVVAVFGFWHGFRNFRYRKYVVFDRKRHLVHIPRLLGPEMDVVRWEDAGFCVVDTITGYAGVGTDGNVYVCRPPWDLVRDGYPPMRFRVPIDGVAERYGGGRGAERIWRFIVNCMTPPMAQSFIGDFKDSDMVAFVDRVYGGDWDPFFREEWPRRLGAPKGALLHFRPAQLATTPNWLREPDGRWRWVGNGRSDSAGETG